MAACTGLTAIGVSSVTPGVAAATSSPVTVSTFTPNLTLVGSVDLSTLPVTPTHVATAAQGTAPQVDRSAPGGHIADPQAAAHRPKGTVTSTPGASTSPVTSQNVRGESGFVGLTGPSQAAANGGLDLEPPDQGLCAGGGYVTEFINNALTIYQPDGVQLLPVIPSYAIFKQTSTAFFSDPRCYYDAPTQRWFLQEFIVGTVGKDGKSTSPSLQFLAVSDTADPTGSYSIWSIDTTDTSTANCPCFGDYDQIGADDNGIYIATDEFAIAGNGYNGVVLYALSKELIETFSSTGIPPVAFGYRLTQDYFGQPYIVSPSETPQGARFAPNTEYFVESNGDALSDNHLAVYALTDTSLLAAPAAPGLSATEVTSEAYAAPFDAKQAPGSRPLGTSVQDPEGQLQADFDAVMQVTSLKGHVYGELNTSTTGGHDAAAWFILKTKASGSKLTATVVHQGYVAPQGLSVLYPITALDASGKGDMAFAVSGTTDHPSAAYISYGAQGPTGPVRIASAGVAPEDSFTCYAAFVGPSYGGCRWGDYSMGVASGGRVYMATEMIPSASRDYLTNWGTYVWSAPSSAG
ncbi:MAG TPA: hypothetical protein VN796_08410 [Acidimicrobiales bacterium]|nr:hypothetical protein [Acidimicrobiales bacterium]